ncbi:hypothetical protein MMC17_007481 [Xylographa soralifera]|nr:hypothetical protein [Xylographa soralifera]
MAEPLVKATSSNTEGTVEKKILEACFSGDLQGLQQQFSKLGIASGHRIIYSPLHHLTRPSEPPPTYQMVDAAVSAKQPAILSYLLTTFPTIRIAEPLVTLAIEHASVPVYELMLAHDPSILNLGIHPHDNSPLACACLCGKTALALHLLDKRADPKCRFWIHLSTLQCALRAHQPIELIRALIEHGAETDSVLEYAVKNDEMNDVRCLLDAGAETGIVKRLLKDKEVRKNQRMMALLKREGQGSPPRSAWKVMLDFMKKSS